MSARPWALEESVEDCLVAYCQSNLPAEWKVYPAWTEENLQFPAVVVMGGATANVASEDASFSGHRLVSAQVSVMVEATPETDAAGVVLKTPREVNRAARAEVVALFARDDLVTQFGLMNTPNLIVGMAQLGEASRSIEGRVFVTTLNVLVGCQPIN